MFTCRPWVMSQQTAIRGAKSPSLTVLPLDTLGFSPRQWGTIVHELQAAPNKPLALGGNITRFLQRAKLEEEWTTEGRPGTTTTGGKKNSIQQMQTVGKKSDDTFPHHFWHSYGQYRNALPDNQAKRSNGVENLPAACHPIPRLLHQAA